MEAKIRVGEMWRCYTTGFKNEGRGHSRECSGSLEAGKGKELNSPLRVSKRNAALLTSWY